MEETLSRSHAMRGGRIGCESVLETEGNSFAVYKPRTRIYTKTRLFSRISITDRIDEIWAILSLFSTRDDDALCGILFTWSSQDLFGK